MRRAALLTNEQLWAESADTAKGRTEHERVHTARVERRGSEIKLYEYNVFSESLSIGGKCDCIEATEDEHGCMLPDIEFPVRLYPIEYKHGSMRTEEEYELQLCAQAMCLEEMYGTSIDEGAIFYISSHKRQPVVFSETLRQKVRAITAELDSIRRSFSVPAAEYSAKCKRCSLLTLCMPQVKRSAADYCAALRSVAKEVEKL